MMTKTYDKKLIGATTILALGVLGTLLGHINTRPQNATSSAVAIAEKQATTTASVTTSLQDLDECIDFYGYIRPGEGDHITVARQTTFPCPVMPPQKMFDECRTQMVALI